MSEESDPVDALEAQMTALSDTHENLTGLVEKAVRIQSDLLAAGFEQFSEAVNGPFSSMSTAADQLQALLHDIELERNRIRNEE